MQTQQPYSPTNYETPTAVMGRRILAYILDLLPAAIITGVAYGTATTRYASGSVGRAELDCERVRELTDDICTVVNEEAWVTDAGDMALGGLAVIAYLVIFTAILPGVAGWSPGKLATGIRVVKQDTFEVAGIGPNLIRWVLWIVDAVPYCFPLVGLITGLATAGNRRVGDMAASTLVVDKSSVGRPVPIRGLSAAVVPTSPAPPPPVPGTAWSPPTGPPSAAPTTPPVAAPGVPPGAPPTPAPRVAEPPSFPPLPESGATPPEFPPPPPTETAPGAPVPLPPESEAEPATDAGFVAPGAEPTEVLPAFGIDEPTSVLPVNEPEAIATPQPPAASDEPEPPATPETEPPPEPPRPGVEAPMWDSERNTYIQWDPELDEWMEWDERGGRWIPISR